MKQFIIIHTHSFIINTHEFILKHARLFGCKIYTMFNLYKTHAMSEILTYLLISDILTLTRLIILDGLK